MKTQTLKSYKTCSSQELREWFAAHGQPAFRQQQVNDWLLKKWATGNEEMANLPKTLRTLLNAEFSLFSLQPLEKQVASDGTVKFLFALRDGETVETVLIPAQARDTVCISTQVGCPVGCVFCATGRQGFIRDLTMDEIVDQVIFACAHLQRRISNVVVMGMGEPLLNLSSLIPALAMMTDAGGLDLGARRITVSTSGIPDGIRALAAAGKQWNLAWSLHAPDDETRARLIPGKWRFPIHEILGACREYRTATGRKITIEYALVKGMNDDLLQAAKVAGLARKINAKVNLIPCNNVSENLKAPDSRNVDAFKAAITAHGVTATVRSSRGEEITAACGQLRQRPSDRT